VYDGKTHQHAVMPMLVQQQHACLKAHGDLFFSRAPVVWVKNRLAADADGNKGVVFNQSAVLVSSWAEG